MKIIKWGKFRDVKLLVRIKFVKTRATTSVLGRSTQVTWLREALKRIISNNCLNKGHIRKFCCFTIKILS